MRNQPCDCAIVWGTPCDSEQDADCVVLWNGRELEVTSECLYAMLDRDDCERP